MFVRCTLRSWAVAAIGCIGCAGARPAEYATVERQVDAPAAPEGPLAEKTPTLAEDEAVVPKEARLDAITRIALAKSPGLEEARARTKSALARAKATGRLPDLEFKYELWGQPLNKPWALGETQMHMFGLRQTFPAAGTLDAQTRIAMEEAKVALELQRAKELDVVADVKKAWANYHAAVREKQVHVEHVDVTSRLFQVAKVQLQVGKTTQADVLRFDLERTKVHADILSLDQQLVTSRARLNALMGRSFDAPLGPPPDFAPGDVAPKVAELRAIVSRKRPELAAADAEIRKGEAEVAGAKSASNWPSVMVGIDYQLMPMATMPHNFGAMIQFSLPWLNPRRHEEVTAAEASVSASKSAKKALETEILLQLEESLARYDTAKRTLVLYDEELIPQAQKTFDAMQASWSAGGGDAISVIDGLRTLLALRIERSRALGNLEIAVADLERTIGAPLPRTKKAEVKP